MGKNARNLGQDIMKGEWAGSRKPEAMNESSFNPSGVDLFGDAIADKANPLAEKFIMPPFSVLSARSGEWRARKKAWLSLGIKSELGRGCAPSGSLMPAADYSNGQRGTGTGASLGNEVSASIRAIKPSADSANGVSVFDPVLCELAYSWFCPPGGMVLDPFAGGSVRGIVAGVLGRRYWGCELRKQQVDENNKQADKILNSRMTRETHGDLLVLTDPLPGGTKERAFSAIAPSYGASEFVYASSRWGLAQVAIARVSSSLGKKATIFIPESKDDSEQTKLAIRFGATIKRINPGYLSVLQARAKEYAKENNGAVLLPFDLESEEMIEAIADIARAEIPNGANEIWCAAGSGTLAKALKKAFPLASVNAVCIGSECAIDGVSMYMAPESFDQSAKHDPPFPSFPKYDAKVWQFARDRVGVLWNVGTPEQNVSWTCGDSLEVIDDHAPDADFIFSCPPYGDLEVYSDDPKDLSNMEYHTFISAYSRIILKAVKKLRLGGLACFVVGDFRNPKTGAYRGFVHDTYRAFQNAGCSLFNDAVLLTAIGSLPVRVSSQFDKGRKLGKAHQNVLVFRKDREGVGQ